MSYETPNYTPVPNEFFDVDLRILTGAEAKTLLAIFRKTFGFRDKYGEGRKISDSISISQICEISGLGRSTAIEAAKTLEQKGRVKTEKKNGVPTTFFVVFELENDEDPSKNQTGPENRPVQNLDPTRPKIGLVTPQTRPESGPTKEKNINKLSKEMSELVELLVSTHKKNIDDKWNPTESQKEKWAGDIEKLIRIDGRTLEEVRKVILWVKQPGEFWAPNIMSGSKLREKFPTLLAQMNRAGLGKNGINGDKLKVHERTALDI